jgi:DNA-binding response OmpR family regulator
MSKSPLLLVVEDDVPIMDIIMKGLEKEGFNLINANDGDLGLELAINSHPDIILLDILMPKMNGLAMLRELRADPWGKDAKVIIITNLSNPESEKEARDLMANDYIIKSDLSLKQLVDHIHKLLPAK